MLQKNIAILQYCITLNLNLNLNEKIKKLKKIETQHNWRIKQNNERQQYCNSLSMYLVNLLIL